MNISDLYNKLKIYIFVLLNLRRKRKNSVYGSDILLSFFRSLGDAVLALDMFREIDNLYRDNRRIFLVTNKTVAEYYSAYGELNNIEIIIVNFDNYKEIFKKLSKNNYQIIINYQSNLLSLITAIMNAKEKVLLSDNSEFESRLRRRYTSDRVYSKIIICDKNEMYFERYKRILNYLGITSYCTKIGRIYKKRKNEFKTTGCVVISPGASTTSRYLTEKILNDIVTYLIENNERIVFVGDEKHFEWIESLNLKVEKNSFLNLAGKTSLDQLISILADAKYVISTDTGTAHLSTALGKKTVCLSGYWDYKVFFPYDVENKKNLFQIAVFRDDVPECFGCAQRKYVGHKNMACIKAVRAGNPNMCLSSISGKKIIKAIQAL